MQNEEPIEVRLLGEADIGAAVRLKELAHWNQTEDDWRRLLLLEPNGCFCATAGGSVVGTTTTTTYGRDLAWIGMVLVDPDYRRRGIATRMMHLALDYLRDSGVVAVKLDATPDGRPVYESLGFRAESLIERWEGVAVGQAVGCSTLDSSARPQALTLDRCAFGADRSKLIEMLVEDACVAPLASMAPNGRLTGYALARRGTAAAYVGPLVTTISDGAPALLDGLLSQLTSQRVYIDVNTDFVLGTEIVAARGFVKQRELIRMGYGKESKTGSSPSIFAIAGPEIG
jgi:GNAT superfamily N-acetyltransferase